MLKSLTQQHLKIFPVGFFTNLDSQAWRTLVKQAKKLFFWSIATITAVMLSSCAQYRVSTNRVNGYEGHIEQLSIWSAIGTVELLARKPWLASASFSDRFEAALKTNFQNENINAVVYKLTSKSFIEDQVEPLEKELHPNMRLLIQPTRCQTITHNGATYVAGLLLDLSLIDVASGRLVWRGAINMDVGLDPTVWTDTGANKLSRQIVDALKKDNFM